MSTARCEYCGQEERYGHNAVCVMNEVSELRDALKRKDALIEKLHVVAKNVSHALMSFTPGGSEYFTRVHIDDFEDYYADADVCQKRVRERISNAEEGVREQYREIAKLRAALNDIVNPMDVLRRQAEAEGAVLNHMAHGIAHSPGFLRDIAQRALTSGHHDGGGNDV